MKNWLVYIIQCADESLYTGITIDIKKRFQQHSSQQGAKYFRARKPKKIVYLELDHDRSSASKREYAIKQLSRADKICLIASNKNQKSGLKTKD
ncbi:MAG: GIY-YIG nuclease family protein [Methylococcales symbiont of Iophon sp. n. MRB-2018]|nr:MAG: GIY-YIG nuclease family protein [Methylococcales symbiont of Iophon sp. n. MRB-2018]KAF3980459.1 MAG: GIY-YIG nuclease family protein [Methylococcales symbiont of Iophon sp. n. MRB-2018]